jgi:hypothetical protein
MKFLAASFLAVISAAGLASAHLQQGSLSIKGGETFHVGEVVTVTLIQTVGHNNGKYDFYYSKDGGSKWTEIIGNWQGPKEDGATVTYKWTVPNQPSTTAQFRACQLAGGECVDPIYILKSGNFTITNATGIVEMQARSGEPSLRFDPATHALQADFDLARAEDVSLQVLDAAGHEVATLLQGRQEAGSHRVSVFSNRLENASGHLLLNLTMGSESYTQAWNAAR